MTKREIRFRVWDKEYEEFSNWTNRDPHFSVSSDQIFFWERVKNQDGSYDGDIILEDLNKRFVLQQFIGLLDKNKKEIYEGDIIRYESGGTARNAEVWWDEEFAMFCFDRNYEFTFMDKVQNIEVIGNIFETPDLLK